ncbi:MAG: PHP domain-containing protein [Thermoleophilia bacterium]
MIVDYHMHMRGPLADGSEPLVLDVSTVERYCEVAAARGVDEIAFTEHVYYFAQTREVWWLPYQRERCGFDLDRYVEAVLEGRRRGLPVKLGLEVDWVGPRQAALAEALAPYPWDVLLGSVHWLGDLEVDLQPGIWATTGVEEAWRRYVDALCELVGLGLVDVVAHPDLAKIFGDRPIPRSRPSCTSGSPTRSRRPGWPRRSRPRACASQSGSPTPTRVCCAPSTRAACRSRSRPTRTSSTTSATASRRRSSSRAASATKR